ncbi:hypothetical protein [Pseudomonas sp. JV241A]|jgi:hypothetical protein|uniref:hypothetical protein n=1 Tax=Pseudomonas sp. JV241A TaxID=2078785 RepID=UPI00100D5A65|nr:hypothetical protein [Pseudomonas sp. JV241A]SPO67768.1 conserved exported protein of unknown function [Pseudomonas sp. JV241A]
MIPLPRLLLSLSLATLLPCATVEAALPVSVYQGTQGDTAVEVALTYDAQHQTVEGYWLEAQRQWLIPLERTPYDHRLPLLINLLDNPDLPSAALLIQPFAFSHDRELRGTRVNLRNRERQALELKRVTRFSDRRDASWQGELLQLPLDGRRLFRVHAHKAAGEYVGTVDRITILDRTSGQPVQVIDNLALFFQGSASLSFADFNGDGVIDFKATPVGQLASGGAAGQDPQYYVYQPASNRYELKTEQQARERNR